MSTARPDADGTLILGAGPAGLACAMELCKAGRVATLVERDSQVGGLAKTLRLEEEDGSVFLTDIGPHRFFSKNAYLYEFIEDLLHEEWKLVPRQTRQFIEGKFYDYPVNAMQVFRNIGPFKAARIALDYLLARLRFRLFHRPVHTFEDYVVAHFGRTLAEFSMINYTEKIWGIPASTIHPDWAKQRISGLNLFSVLKKALFLGGGGGPKSLVDEFYYPEFGTGRIYEQIVERLKEKRFGLHLESVPTQVRHDGKRILEVDVRGPDGTVRTHRPEHLVESVPLTEFVQLFEPAPPKEVLEALASLRWRSQLYLFLTLDRPSITQDNWIYFPGREIPFGRVSEMKNFSARMSPKDKTSLFVEFFVFETDPLWTASKEEVVEQVVPFFERWGFFQRSEVRQVHLMKRRFVYPVYDMTYVERLKVVKDWLDRFENLIYVGRPGRFKYTNQDHSLEMGILASRSIVEGRRYDLDRVGAENEYFEQGRIYEKRL